MNLITSLTETKSEDAKKKVPVNVVFIMFLDALAVYKRYLKIRVGKLTMQLLNLIVCLTEVKMLALKLLMVNTKIFVSCMFFFINYFRLLLP